MVENIAKIKFLITPKHNTLNNEKMSFYKRSIEFIDVNIIYCLVPIILTLLVVTIIFKKKYETKKALKVICWFIILYSAVTLSYYSLAMIMSPEKFVISKRATGLYNWAYWIMLLSAVALPFTLLIKKIASNFLYVLFVAIFMKIGFYFERFVIILTSYHRDYALESKNVAFTDSYTFGLLLLFIQGMIIALLLLGLFEIFKMKLFQSKGFVNGL